MNDKKEMSCWEQKYKKECSQLSNDELLSLYAQFVFDSLGSEAEIMIERGYSEIDIKEQYKYDRIDQKKENIVLSLCEERNIDVGEVFGL